jgi:hypothetical protein
MWPAPAPVNIPVDASAELLWEVMLDLNGYGPWNPFIVWAARPSVLPVSVGDHSTSHGRLTARRRQITVSSTASTARWTASRDSSV